MEDAGGDPGHCCPGAHLSAGVGGSPHRAVTHFGDSVTVFSGWTRQGKWPCGASARGHSAIHPKRMARGWTLVPLSRPRVTPGNSERPVPLGVTPSPQTYFAVESFLLKHVLLLCAHWCLMERILGSVLTTLFIVKGSREVQGTCPCPWWRDRCLLCRWLWGSVID